MKEVYGSDFIKRNYCLLSEGKAVFKYCCYHYLFQEHVRVKIVSQYLVQRNRISISFSVQLFMHSDSFSISLNLSNWIKCGLTRFRDVNY